MKDFDQYENIPFDDTSLPIRINFGCPLPPIRFTPCAYRWHEQLELLYFHRGGAAVHCGNKTYMARDGDILLVNPYEIHQVSYENGSPLYDCLMIDTSLYCSTRDGACEMRYFHWLLDECVGFENRIAGDAAVSAHVQALCRELQDKQFAYELAVKSHVFGLFVCLFRDYLRSNAVLSPSSKGASVHDHVKAALTYMQVHFSEHLTLEKIAASCNLSPSHFCRLFRQITGTTAMRYLTIIRLQEAASLLRQSDKSIAQIAEDVGFEEAGYMSRKFKEEYHTTPLQYKKQYAQEKTAL